MTIRTQAVGLVTAARTWLTLALLVAGPPVLAGTPINERRAADPAGHVEGAVCLTG